METLLLIGALATTLASELKEPTSEEAVTLDKGLGKLDWTLARNFRTQSVENNVEWVVVTDFTQ